MEKIEIPSDILQVLLHLDANRCGMDHKPYREVMAQIRELVARKVGPENLTPERE